MKSLRYSFRGVERVAPRSRGSAAMLSLITGVALLGSSQASSLFVGPIPYLIDVSHRMNDYRRIKGTYASNMSDLASVVRESPDVFGGTGYSYAIVEAGTNFYRAVSANTVNGWDYEMTPALPCPVRVFSDPAERRAEKVRLLARMRVADTNIAARVKDVIDLSSFFDRDVKERFIEVAGEGGWPLVVKQQAASHFADMVDPDDRSMAATVLEVATASDNYAIRLCMAKALGKIGNEDSLQWLLESAAADNGKGPRPLREAALAAIVQIRRGPSRIDQGPHGTSP